MLFFFNDTATTEIYTLSLHDALPISSGSSGLLAGTLRVLRRGRACRHHSRRRDRKSTRLNSSHGYISYAVFCLKKKKSCISAGISACRSSCTPPLLLTRHHEQNHQVF